MQQQLDEKKIIEEYQEIEIQRKMDECIKLEEEAKILRSNLEKARSFEEKFKRSSTMLDELINSQRTEMNKSGLGFEEGQISKVKQSTRRRLRVKIEKIRI